MTRASSGGKGGEMAALRALARRVGVRTSYTDATGSRKTSREASVRRVLGSLGWDVSRGGEAAKQCARFDAALAKRRIEPVVVAWGGRGSVEVRLRESDGDARVGVGLALEDGSEAGGAHRLGELAVRESKDADGETRRFARVPLPGVLPEGYHRLELRIGRERHGAWVLSAPARTYHPGGGRLDHEWGVFAPLYAVRSARDAGVGDLTDLRELLALVRSRGGRMIATLPMLASFLDEPFDPSPYAPASRLFWNELFADPSRAEGFGDSGARRVMRSSSWARERDALQRSGMVQYRRATALKRRLLEPLAAWFADSGGFRGEAFRGYEEVEPRVWDYALFRAVGERQKASWHEWPTGQRGGEITRRDARAEDVNYHAYVQHLFHEQMSELAREAGAGGGLVYLDLPVGVHPDSYDVYRNRDLYLLDASVGAPPDPVFTGGQDWGFPPMHPERIREEGYAHFRDVLRNHMRYADCLRLDHVMAFDRLYHIPVGVESREGVYVGYHPEEFYAVLSIESHRARCRVIGENLGTVPAAVNRRMEKRGIGRMFVLQYEAQAGGDGEVPAPEPDCVASVNTHDMPPFAAWLEGSDIPMRVDAGVLDAGLADREREGRSEQVATLRRELRARGYVDERGVDAGALRDGVHRFLGDSDAELVVLNLEDLWLETRCQNIPGTVTEHPNWRHRLRHDLEAIEADPEIRGAMEDVERLRAGRRAGVGAG